MATAQHPIGSGFGARSTATDVLQGLDLTGRFAIVTGGYSGIGLETTKALAAAGADVLVPARRPDHAAAELAGVDRVTVGELDLADLDSVRAFAARVLDAGRPVDMLLNNAGIMACPEARVGAGWESQLGTNHLGHFVLANLLWPVLVDGGARVVAVSSAGHKRSPIRWDDLQFETGYDKWQAYGQAKTANALFALHLDTLGAPSGVRAFSLHPGAILTPLQRHMEREEMIGLGWIDEAGTVNPAFKTTEQGAATTTWAATAPRLDGLGGVYCEDCEIAVPASEAPPGSRSGVEDYAADPEAAARLWSVSADLTGVDAFAKA